MAFSSRDYRFTLQLTDELGNTYNNVFAYQANNDLGSASDLADAFLDEIMPLLVPIIHEDASVSSVVVANLDDVTDYFDGTYVSQDGTATGDKAPPFVGFAFRLHRPHAGVRHGRKTFGPISESHQANGQATAGALTLLTPLAAGLTAAITSSGGPTSYAICIPKTVKVTPLGKDPYYVWDELIPANAVSYIRVSSQVSRRNYSV